MTLDQDALPAPDMVSELCRAYSLLEGGKGIAILAPQLHDPQIDRWAPFLKPVVGPLYRRSVCRGEVLSGVTTAVTAGVLMRLDVMDEIGGFREDFFIDYVDAEFCLRARSHGFKIAVACNVRMQHRLGDRDEQRRGPFIFFPTHHPPERRYYFGRNRMPMLWMYVLRFPHWFLYDLVAGTYGMIRMLLTESQRKQKPLAFLRGYSTMWSGRWVSIGSAYKRADIQPSSELGGLNCSNFGSDVTLDVVFNTYLCLIRRCHPVRHSSSSLWLWDHLLSRYPS
jgi:rhamnosyltransferase